MNDILIIYSYSIDKIRIYKLRVNDDDFEKMKSCHDFFINVRNGEHLEWLFDFLKNKPVIYDGNKLHQPLIEIIEPTTLVITGGMWITYHE